MTYSDYLPGPGDTSFLVPVVLSLEGAFIIFIYLGDNILPSNWASFAINLVALPWYL